MKTAVLALLLLHELLPGLPRSLGAVQPARAEGDPPGFPAEPCPAERVDYRVGQGESYPEYAARARRRRCHKPWTVLVYMAADNDLAPYALWDLYEMEAGFRTGRRAAGSTARSDLLVQLAMPGAPVSRRLHVFQSPEIFDGSLTIEPFRRRAARGEVAAIRSPVAGLVPRQNESGPIPAGEDLAAFLEWGIREYPSRHYMVVVWGHGQGWTSGKAPSPAGRGFGGLAFADSRGTFLDIPTLRRALRDVEDRLLAGRPVDIYASDACLMQVAEVAAEMSDAARFVIGSAQVQDYLGLPYRRLMFELNENRFSGERKRAGVAGSTLVSDEPYLLARMLPRIFKASLGAGGLHGRLSPEAIRTVTMSAVASDELRSELVPALEALGRALERYVAEAPSRAIDLRETMRRAPSYLGGSRELGGWLTLLAERLRHEREDPQALRLGRAVARAASALDRAVVSYSLGTRYTGADEQRLYLLGFRGLSLWLPSSSRDYGARVEDFAASWLYRQAPSWNRWLARVF